MTATNILAIVLLVMGAIVIIAEMHTLTFYLLAVAAACFAAAGMAFAGAGLTTTLMTLAIVLLLGMPAAHWLRLRMRNRASEDISRDDTGHEVTLLALGQPYLRVSYRGTAWQARFVSEPAAAPAPGERFVIAAREGNVLLLVPPAAAH